MTRNILVERHFPRDAATVGLLSLDGRAECFSLEDRVRDVKIAGVTAIPAGRYLCRPREGGRLYEPYRKRWPGHRGMIWLQDVPGFSYVYIHVGNTARDTHGCILVGCGCDVEGGTLSRSRVAYWRLYRKVMGALYDGTLFVEVA